VVALVALVVAWTLLPLLPLPLWSLSGRWRWPDLLPERWSGRAWAYLLSPTAQALPALITSVLLAMTVTVLALAVGLPAALALGRRQFRGRASRAADLRADSGAAADGLDGRAGIVHRADAGVLAGRGA
jgi:ABC-type spermidine/putrescine transport system permease subunit II